MLKTIYLIDKNLFSSSFLDSCNGITHRGGLFGGRERKGVILIRAQNNWMKIY
jgi:hypothetical protein